jgi:hypothetical protein
MEAEDFTEPPFGFSFVAGLYPSLIIFVLYRYCILLGFLFRGGSFPLA